MLNESTEYIYVYFNMFKYYILSFKNKFKMAAVKMENNILESFKNSSWAHVLFCTETSVSRIIWFRGIY